MFQSDEVHFFYAHPCAFWFAESTISRVQLLVQMTKVKINIRFVFVSISVQVSAMQVSIHILIFMYTFLTSLSIT